MTIKNFQKCKLKNGIIILFEKRELPLVSLSISNKSGAAYETSNIKGIAHFIEHLVFTGTKTRTHEQISAEIEKKGGILNAFTIQDLTSFWFKLPSKHIFSGLNILTDILNNPSFNPEKFEKEKKVIIEEIKMYHDAPQTHIYEKIENNLFEKPFGEGIIGSEKTVSSLQRDFVVDYFSKMYNPANFIVTVVGKADFKKICNYIEKNFKPKKTSLELQKIKKQNAKTIEERSDIDQAHFVFAVHAPLPHQKDYNALEVLDAYLANGMSSRLFLKIREEKGLAYIVKSNIISEKNYSYYSIYVGTKKEALPEIKKIILEEFENLNKMALEDLKQAKERLLGLKKIAAEDSTNVALFLLMYELTTKAEDYYNYEKDINAVSLDEVKKLAQELIKEYSTASIVPK